MGLETVSYVSDLVITNPTASDEKSAGDDHIRNIKKALRATLPNLAGAMSATHAELNHSVGVTSAIQTQIDTKAPTASPTFTGTPAAPTASFGASGTQLATLDFVNAVAMNTVLPSQTGNSGKYLTTNGTTSSWSSPALVLLATITPTATTTAESLSAFTSSYDNYVIIGTGIIPDSDDVLECRVANAGVVDTASNYAIAAVGSSSTTTATSATLTVTVLASGQGANFEIRVMNANATTAGKSLKINGVSQNAATPSWSAIDKIVYYAGTSAISGVQFFFTSGANFTAAGKIRIYGYAN